MLANTPLQRQPACTWSPLTGASAQRERASFSAAARDLRLSNAAVSKNVRELEEELGAPLLQRTTRRVHLTAAGEQYYARVVAVLDELDGADRAVSEHSSAPRGRLRVAAPMSFGLSELAAQVAAFGKLYPELTVELELNDRFVDVIQEGFDVAVRGSGPLPDSNLVAKKLLDIERCGLRVARVRGAKWRAPIAARVGPAPLFDL